MRLFLPSGLFRQIWFTVRTTASVCSLLTLAHPAFSQTDAELFAQGRIAFDKYKDCPAAEKSFAGVSVEGQRSPLWLSYMARTEECLGKLQNALNYYEQYNRAVPGQAEIVNKMADLRYQISKAREKQQADMQAASALRQQQQMELDRQAAQTAEATRQHNALRADALRTLRSDSARLVTLVNDHPRDKSGYEKSFKASAPSTCQMQIEDRSGDYGHEVTALDFTQIVSVSGPFSDRSINVTCKDNSECSSTKDLSHAAFEHHVAQDSQSSRFGFTFQTQDEAVEAANLMGRIAAACERQGNQ